MTQEAAQTAFWESFGIPAYANTAVPNKPELPYLTYQAASGYWGDSSNITVQLWYYTENEAIPNAKAREIAERIGYGGKTLHCDGGIMRLHRGNPWRVNTTAQGEPNLKVRQLNVTIDFVITED